MTNYKERMRERRTVEKRIGKPPKHVPKTLHAEPPSPAQASDPPAAVVDPLPATGVESALVGYSVFNPFQVKESMMSTKDAQAGKPTLADAMAKRKERDDARIAKAAEKERARAIKAAAQTQNREQKAAERAARQAASASDSPMATLRDAKKRYVKSATGQYRTPDALGDILDAVPADRIVDLVIEVLDLKGNPYLFLNRGQQSMNLRNKLRFAIKRGEVTLARIEEVRDAGQYTLTEEQMAEAEAARKAEKARRFY
jgi:hypothetical protein